MGNWAIVAAAALFIVMVGFTFWVGYRMGCTDTMQAQRWARVEHGVDEVLIHVDGTATMRLTGPVTVIQQGEVPDARSS